MINEYFRGLIPKITQLSNMMDEVVAIVEDNERNVSESRIFFEIDGKLHEMKSFTVDDLLVIEEFSKDPFIRKLCDQIDFFYARISNEEIPIEMVENIINSMKALRRFIPESHIKNISGQIDTLQLLIDAGLDN